MSAYSADASAHLSDDQSVKERWKAALKTLWPDGLVSLEGFRRGLRWFPLNCAGGMLGLRQQANALTDMGYRTKYG